jgi:hypothetical protein
VKKLLENELLQFQQEIGEIKQDLLTSGITANPNDDESYRLATKIDLTVSRLMRLLECK